MDAPIARCLLAQARPLGPGAGDPQPYVAPDVAHRLNQQTDPLRVVESADREHVATIAARPRREARGGVRNEGIGPLGEVAVAGADRGRDSSEAPYGGGVEGHAVEVVDDLPDQGAGEGEQRRVELAAADRRQAFECLGQAFAITGSVGHQLLQLRDRSRGVAQPIGKTEEVVRVIEAAKAVEHVADVVGMSGHPGWILAGDDDVEAREVELAEALVALDQLPERTFGGG